jgi:nucleotide-binding universal stress UspA family protein
MFEHVLIPIDGSAMSERAVAFAARLPPRSAVLLRVEPDFQVLRPGPLEHFRPDWRETVTAEVEAGLQPLVDQLHGQGQQVTVEVRFGDPAAEIIAASAAADLVVMTTHARGPAGRVFFGSVADRVVRHGPVPTLLIRGSADPVTADQIARIVVPLDGSALAEAAVPAATDLATALQVPVLLVHVIEPAEGVTLVPGMVWMSVPLTPEAMPDQAEQERVATRYLSTWVDRLATGLEVSPAIRVGYPAEVLLDLLKPDDLLVMTTHGRGGLERWLLGSVAEKLVREAPSPVLLVRARPGGATRPDEAAAPA